MKKEISRISNFEKAIILFFNIFNLFFCENIIVMIAYIIILYYFFKKNNTMTLYEKILALLLLMINTSFKTVIGISYSVLPLSAFNLLLISIFIYTFIKDNKRIKNYYIIYFLIIILFLLKLFFLNSLSVSDAVKQMVNILGFMLVLPISIYTHKNCKIVFRRKYIDYYILNVLFFSFIVIIQFLLFTKFGIKVGKFEFMGQSRISYSGLFDDYSFASLYLMSGVALLIQEMLNNNKEICLKNILILTTIFYANLKVNARTGITGLAVAIIIYIFIEIAKTIKSNKISFRKSALILAFAVLLVLIIQQLMANRTGQNLFSDSGRFNTYKAGLEIFMDNLFLGGPLGVRNFKIIAGTAIPHNFVIQLLAQLGLIGSILIAGIFLLYFKSCFVEKNLLLIMTIFCGAMFIPDIFNSRFIIVTFILASIKEKTMETERLY